MPRGWRCSAGWCSRRRGRARPRARGVAATGRADPRRSPTGCGSARPSRRSSRCTNLGPRTLRAVVRDGWEPSAGVAGPNRTRLRIPPGERRRMSLQLDPVATRRSTHGGGHDPLVGAARPLVAGRRRSPRPGASACCRRSTPAAHLPSRLTRLRELDGRTPLLIRGQGTEFDSIREYVRGDDVRSIDWRATARHVDPEVPGSMRLMVRTWRPERDRRIVIVADTSRTAAARIDDEPRLDTAFEASLLLAALASHAGDRVDFLAWDRRLRGRVHGAVGRRAARPHGRRHGGRSRPSSSRPTGRRCPARCAGSPASARSWCCSPRPTRPAAPAACSSVLPQLTRTAHRGGRVRRRPRAARGAVHERNDLDEVYAAVGGRARPARRRARRRRHPPPRRRSP